MADPSSSPIPIDTDLEMIRRLGVDESTQHLLLILQISRNIDKTFNNFSQQVNAMALQLDALTQQVHANTDVIQSALALINGFKDRLDEAVAAVQAGDQSKLTDLQNELAASDQQLAAAVAANTLAAPPADAGSTGTPTTETTDPAATPSDPEAPTS